MNINYKKLQSTIETITTTCSRQFPLLPYGVTHLMMLALLMVLSTPEAHSCSDQILKGSMYDYSWVVSGRNLDLDNAPSMEVVFYPKDMEFSTTDSKGTASLSWTSAYQFYGIELAQNSNKPIDGLNSQGLSAALLWMNESEFFESSVNNPEPGSPSPMALSDLVAWLLGSFKTVSEARLAFQYIDVWYDSANLPSPCHLVIHDAKGDSLVVEWLDQKTVFISRENGYNGTLTNGPDYAKQLKNLRNFKNLTNYPGQMAGLPGDRTSMSRFAMLAVLSKYAKQTATQQDNWFCFWTLEDVYGSVFCAQQLLHLMNRSSILRGEIRTENNSTTTMNHTVLTLVRDHKGTIDNNKGPILYYRFNNTVTLRQILVAAEVKRQKAPGSIVVDSFACPAPVSLQRSTITPTMRIAPKRERSNSLNILVTIPATRTSQKEADACFVFAKTVDGDLLIWNEGNNTWIKPENGQIPAVVYNSNQPEEIVLPLSKRLLEKYPGMILFAGRGISNADMFASDSFTRIYTIPKLSSESFNNE